MHEKRYDFIIIYYLFITSIYYLFTVEQTHRYLKELHCIIIIYLIQDKLIVTFMVYCVLKDSNNLCFKK